MKWGRSRQECLRYAERSTFNFQQRSLWQDLAPSGPGLEQCFAEQSNGGRAVAEHLILEFAQGVGRSLLVLVILAQFQNLEFAQGVMEIAGIERATNRFLPGWLVFVIAILLEEFRRVFHGHSLAV